VNSTTLGGNAEGEANLPRLVAEATLDALRPLLPPALNLSVINLNEASLDAERTVISVVLLWESEERRQELVGSAFLREDAPRSVASAVLDALNRPLTQLLRRRDEV
jgi:hypothetical protein